MCFTRLPIFIEAICGSRFRGTSSNIARLRLDMRDTRTSTVRTTEGCAPSRILLAASSVTKRADRIIQRTSHISQAGTSTSRTCSSEPTNAVSATYTLGLIAYETRQFLVLRRRKTLSAILHAPATMPGAQATQLDWCTLPATHRSSRSHLHRCLPLDRLAHAGDGALFPLTERGRRHLCNR